MSGHSKSKLRELPHRVVLPIDEAHQLVDQLSWDADHNYLGSGWGLTVDCPEGFFVVWLTDDNLARYEKIKNDPGTDAAKHREMT